MVAKEAGAYNIAKVKWPLGIRPRGHFQFIRMAPSSSLINAENHHIHFRN
jgi:hypothetical protein